MTPPSEAYESFLASMEIGYEEWHDGVPYDLDALDALPPAERKAIEATLVARPQRQWRDIEALARLRTPAATAAIRYDLAHGDADTRLFAAETLSEAGEPVDIGRHIVAALQQDDMFGGMDRALSLAARHPTDAVKAALLEGARAAKDDRGIHFAALLCFIHGTAAEEFDWDRRPFYLRFSPDDADDRKRAHAELCAELGLAGLNTQP